jgi:hypothetical protein
MFLSLWKWSLRWKIKMKSALFKLQGKSSVHEFCTSEICLCHYAISCYRSNEQLQSVKTSQEYITKDEADSCFCVSCRLCEY